MAQADVLIRGGTVVDGSGAPGRIADVAIQGGHITLVGDGSGVQASQVIDARRQVVSPGFIDIHTHSDVSLLQDGRGQSKLTQGVTTEVTGNCGFSPFPINPAHMELHQDLLAGIGDDALELSWTDVEGYRREAESRGIALNVAPLVGHGALRIAAMGVESGAASPAQMQTMQDLLGRMLDQGARFPVRNAGAARAAVCVARTRQGARWRRSPLCPAQRGAASGSDHRREGAVFACGHQHTLGMGHRRSVDPVFREGGGLRGGRGLRRLPL